MRSSMLAILVLVWSIPSSCLASETVRFQSASAPLSAFVIARAQATGVTPVRAPVEEIAGELYKPEGSGPFLAVVVMHGCGGRVISSERTIAARFVSWGYAFLAVDSFSTRGIRNTCTSGMSTQIMDAFGALDFLSTKPFVDIDHVGIVGFSQGGATALSAAGRYKALFPVHKFAAAVAYYPGSCDITNIEMIPTLIMIGDLDDWSPVEQCRDSVDHSNSSSNIRMITYTGAYHDFDRPTKSAAGINIFGHHLEYNGDAEARSVVELHDFIGQFIAR